MSLNLFKKKPDGLLYSVPQSLPFDGTRIKLATYQDKKAEDGIRKTLKRSVIKEIQFCKIPGADGIEILADGNRVGTFWDYGDALYYKLKNHKYNKAFLSVSDDVYLFID